MALIDFLKDKFFTVTFYFKWTGYNKKGEKNNEYSRQRKRMVGNGSTKKSS